MIDNIKFLDTTFYNNNESDLLKSYIESYYYPLIFSDSDKINNWTKGAQLSVIVRAECNQKCDYCYLTKYGHLSYPAEERASKETLIENFKLLVNVMLDKKLIIPTFDFFAGDLFYDNIFFDFVQIIKEYTLELRKNNINDRVDILIPINTTLFFHDDKVKRLEDLVLEGESINLNYRISISTDGKYSIFTREKNNQINDEFFDKMFTFASKTHAGFHPMISPENVNYAIQNLHWWIDMYKKYNREDWLYPMMLYVRNDGWTDDKIAKFCQFVEACWAAREAKYADINDLAKYAWQKFDSLSEDEKIKFQNEGFDPALFKYFLGEEGENLQCGAVSLFKIQLNNFNIPFCHRLTYNHFVGGKLTINKNDTGHYDLDIIPNAVSTWVSLKSLNLFMNPKCNQCDYRFVCLKGCLGAQFETTSDPLLPIESVCKLQKAHMDTLIKLYKKSGALDYGRAEGWIPKPIDEFINGRLEEFNNDKY